MTIPTIISNSRYRQKKHIKQACRASGRISIPIQGRSTTPRQIKVCHNRAGAKILLQLILMYAL